MIHAGSNPRPGSSNAYIDSVVSGIAAAGHKVVDLQTAHHRNDPFGFREEEGIRAEGGGEIVEIRWINTGVYAGHPPGSGTGSVTPWRDVIPSRKLRKAFEKILERHDPDLLHVQNLFGFPVDLLSCARKRGVPVMFTLQDYTPICPISHLFLAEGRGCPCVLEGAGLTCSQCCGASKGYAQFALEEYFNAVMRGMPQGGWLWRTIAGIRNRISALFAMRRRRPGEEAYRQRRKAMISMLGQADMIHCLSHIQSRRLELSAGTLPGVRVIPVSPPSVRSSRPIPRKKAGETLRFCVLNVARGRKDKGYDYMKEAIGLLSARRSDFRVDWYAEGEGGRNIRFLGTYTLDRLDGIAAESDFSIIPSLWLETQAYTGVEMLARGLPLICSKRAGVSEWVKDGETGILFEPDSPKVLTNLMESLIDDPARVSRMREEAASAAHLVKTHETHLREIEDLYREAVFITKRP